MGEGNAAPAIASTRAASSTPAKSDPSGNPISNMHSIIVDGTDPGTRVNHDLWMNRGLWITRV